MKLAMISILVLSAPVVAQEHLVFRLPMGDDSLRYYQARDYSYSVRSEEVDSTSRITIEATVSIVGTGPGTARAWFERLQVRSADSAANQAYARLLFEPYELRVLSDGNFETVGMPDVAMPDALRARFEHYFAGFFPRVPSQEPAPGTSWQDTIPGGGDLDSGLTIETITSYTVRGDTIIDGSRATAIAFEMSGGGQQSVTLDHGIGVTVSYGARGDGLTIVDWTRRRLLFHGLRTQVQSVARMGREDPEVELVRQSMSVIRLVRLVP